MALTPQARSTLVDAIRAGVPIGHAATYAGISRSALFSYLSRGRDAQELVDAGRAVPKKERFYLDLLDEVAKARSAVAVRNVGLVAKASQGGYTVRTTTRQYRDVHGRVVTETEEVKAPPEWRAAKWLLETSFSRDFGRGAAQVEVVPYPDEDVPVGSGAGGGVAGLAARLVQVRARAELEAGGDVVDAEVVEDDAG